MEKTYNGIRTGYGCKVDEDMHGGPGGGILVAYYECGSIGEAADTAIELLANFYEVTIFSGGHYNPRSYTSAAEIRRDFAKWLEPHDFTKYDSDVYGYVNGRPTFSADEFTFTKRHRGPIHDDAELISFAEKVTSNWYNAGWHQTFATFYLGDYALSEPRASLTAKEFARLKELQQQARDAAKAADDAREWKLSETLYFADNSVEEIWIDKDGNTKRIMTVGPHGDAC